MANQLTDLKVKEVSLVDRPANSETDPLTGQKIARARVALYKRDADEAWDDADSICKAVSGQTVAGVVFPKSDFAYVPDPSKPSTWKLRLTKTPGGAPDSGIVGAAAAALGPGFRGKKVQIPADALAGVKAKVRSAWRKANPDKDPADMPAGIAKGDSMTLQEIEAKVTAQDGLIATVKADNDVLKAQTEEVLKMSKTERKAFGAMGAEKRKEFMAGDAAKRKAMCKEFGPQPDPDDDGDDDSDADKKKAAKKAEQVAKAAHDADRQRIVKLEADNTEIRKAQRLEHFCTVAEAELPNTSGSRVDKGDMLMTMADTFQGGETGEKFKGLMATMKAADKVLGDKYKEIGKWGGGGVKAGTELETKVAEIAKRDKVTDGQAWITASSEVPELFAKYDAEQRAFKPGV